MIASKTHNQLNVKQVKEYELASYTVAILYSVSPLNLAND